MATAVWRLQLVKRLQNAYGPNQIPVERTADPSTAVGMTKGRVALRSESAAG
jgi:hypothetical protein